MATEKELIISICDAAPELDFLFALARRQQVSLTISIEGRKTDVGVYIDSIAPQNEREHPIDYSKPREEDKTWFIEGHFYGNGKNGWQGVFEKPLESKRVKRIAVWGRFQARYSKSKREGQIWTTNFKEDVVQ